MILEVLVNLGGLANISNAEFPNAPGNEVGRFKVDVIYYTLVAIA